MEAAVAAKGEEAWFEDAMAALKAEQAGEWGTDEELAGLVFRELPLYFAQYGDRERRYVQTLEGEIPVGDALKLFNDEVFTTFDLRPQLSRITAPTLVIAGEDDFITGPVCARELAEGLGNAKLVLLADCGHFVFVEQPERFAAEVGGFLT
jgi:proline iminopeptidase